MTSCSPSSTTSSGRSAPIFTGADLAGQALAAGLVDELQLFLLPIVVGGGKPALPDGVRSELELQDTRRFADGAVYLSYRIPNA